MNRKTKNSIIIFVIILLITVSGGIYTFVIKAEEINEKIKIAEELRKDFAKPEDLLVELENLNERVAVLDSILAERKFIIPKDLSQKSFYDFVNDNFNDVPTYAYTNIDFVEKKTEQGVDYHIYKVEGAGTYQKVYELINSIEESKELKKIESAVLSGLTKVDRKGIPRYLVQFNLLVNVYYSNTDQFSTSEYEENKFKPKTLYNAFFPLIRNTIKPNLKNLPDVQGAELLFLFPDGAFVADSHGATHMLKEGDKVYLGYLTEINYETKSVSFMLNKGGIIEEFTLVISKDKSEGKQK